MWGDTGVQTAAPVAALHGWRSVECVPSSPSAPRASCETMQDSGRAPGAPSGYSRCALRPPPSPSSVHRALSILLNHKSSQRRLNQASLQLALLPLNPLSLSLSALCQGGAGGNVCGLLLRKKGQGPRSDHIHPRRKSAGKHGTAGFGSSAPADALRQFGRQPLRAPLLKANDWLHPPSHPPDRPKEGHGRKGGFDRVVRAGDGIHHVKCFLSTAWQPDIQIQSVVLGYQSEKSGCYPHAIVATRDWLILTESLDVSRSRAESSPCPRRKGGTQSSTCCWTPHESQSCHRWFDRHCRLNDNDSATPRPRPWLSDLLFSLTNNPIVPVSPLGGGLLTTKPCHSVLSPRLPM